MKWMFFHLIYYTITHSDICFDLFDLRLNDLRFMLCWRNLVSVEKMLSFEIEKTNLTVSSVREFS